MCANRQALTSIRQVYVFSFRQANFAVLQMTNNLKFNFKFATWFGTLKRQNECQAECEAERERERE